jgi:hypothetical protein
MSHSSIETRCLAALYLTDPQDDRASVISAKGRRVDGTCEWITKNEKFSAWLASQSGFLWLCGGPGKGKTMIAIFLTEELERFIAQPIVVRDPSVGGMIISFWQRYSMSLLMLWTGPHSKENG